MYIYNENACGDDGLVVEQEHRQCILDNENEYILLSSSSSSGTA